MILKLPSPTGMKHQGSSKSDSQRQRESKNFGKKSSENDHEIISNDFETPGPGKSKSKPIQKMFYFHLLSCCRSG